ncbi:MAG: tripartite tricarboxylate transporter TctB family protein [Micromonosporaceae bacterium]
MSSSASEPGRLDGVRKGRVATGVIGVLAGVGYTAMATDLPFGDMQQPGAAVFPVAVGVGCVLISLVTCAEAYFSGAAKGEFTLPPPAARRAFWGFLAAVVAYVLTVPFLGQYLAATLFVVAGIKVLGASLRTAILYGVALGLGLSFAFIELLGVRMPPGIVTP